jgi:hypothetical protein
MFQCDEGVGFSLVYMSKSLSFLSSKPLINHHNQSQLNHSLSKPSLAAVTERVTNVKAYTWRYEKRNTAWNGVQNRQRRSSALFRNASSQHRKRQRNSLYPVAELISDRTIFNSSVYIQKKVCVLKYNFTTCFGWILPSSGSYTSIHDRTQTEIGLRCLRELYVFLPSIIRHNTSQHVSTGSCHPQVAIQVSTTEHRPK